MNDDNYEVWSERTDYYGELLAQGYDFLVARASEWAGGDPGANWSHVGERFLRYMTVDQGFLGHSVHHTLAMALATLDPELVTMYRGHEQVAA